MSDICFSLIDSLLQKEPNKRIDFKQYFEHEFFSQSHKKELIKTLSKEIEEYQKLKEINYLKERLLKNSNNSANGKKDAEKKYNKKEIKYNFNKNKNEFEKRFTKIIKIREYNAGYNLYKAKDTTSDKIVYIKEISRSLIDNNARREILKGNPHYKNYHSLYGDKWFYQTVENMKSGKGPLG
jgi:serine/threonine protein kinase